MTKELEDHIEDRSAIYDRRNGTFRGGRGSGSGDGDPVEVGIEMDRIHRPKMAWKMIGLIAVLNLAGILLMYCLRTSALADVGNNPGE